MIGRRPLGELLGELTDGFAGLASGDGIRVSSLSLGLPIDLRVALTDAGPQLFGDVPLFRTRTDFDPHPARLEVAWFAIPAEEVGR